MMTQDEALHYFEETNALRSGHFELRSGLHSDCFFQCALLLQYPAPTVRLCEALIEKASPALASSSVDAVIAPALGGITVGYEIARQLEVKGIFAEKENGKLVLRRGFEILPGERVVIAEDVVTRGGRVQEVVDIVTARGGVVAAILVLVNRSGGQAVFDAPLFSLVELTPVTWTPDACPLCKDGVPIEHPGS